ncbi:hypothetical protein [Tychonema sp. LEGE 06208]|uniref:hypothetical protein n=1 Tax=Tychonema sp. LEGE 06208 TaxID=1828663 RepID=UPI001882AED7|nr:hypothetical protein [Tychonema sp. LEGE 06208]MBE9164188.1 hypothetical protein [Tychonema sp. LEGE 06208]
MAKPQVQAEQTDITQELTAKKGIQSRVVQAYVEPNVYLEFKVREDFYNYFGLKPTIATTADVAVTKYKPGTGTGTGTASDNNKGNGVSYRSKGKSLAGKKIKFPTTGGDPPPVNSKNVAKKKKTMTIRVPTILSAAAIALWVNTAMDANRRPKYFTLESGTEVWIDPGMTEATKLKPLKSIKGKSEA